MSVTQWPLQSGADAFYGNPRGPAASANLRWEQTRIITIIPPYTMFFAGKVVATIRVNKACAPSLERVLKAIDRAAGSNPKVLADWGASIFGGAYNYRLMRGLNTLSMHAYGCAIDLDPQRNYLGDRTPHFTPDHPVVKAFRDEGWIWGGDWNGNGSSADERRCDGMHFQAARLG